MPKERTTGCQKRNAKRRQKKRKRQEKKRERKLAPSAETDIRAVNPDFQREIEYIQERAIAGDARLVMFSGLVLFSTESRDAWLLDSEDNLALCLMRDGEIQPYRIVDTPTTFQIEWNAQFEISREVFTVIERTGRVRSIVGYPTEQIARACAGQLP